MNCKECNNSFVPRESSQELCLDCFNKKYAVNDYFNGDMNYYAFPNDGATVKGKMKFNREVIMETTVLYYYGENDYGATLFENECKLSALDIIRTMEDKGIDSYSINIDGEIIYFNLLVFDGRIPGQFLIFIRAHIQDYDDSRHRNFTIVEKSSVSDNIKDIGMVKDVY